LLGNTICVKGDANKVVVVVFVDATSRFDRHILNCDQAFFPLAKMRETRDGKDARVE